MTRKLTLSALLTLALLIPAAGALADTEDTPLPGDVQVAAPAASKTHHAAAHRAVPAAATATADSPRQARKHRRSTSRKQASTRKHAARTHAGKAVAPVTKARVKGTSNASVNLPSGRKPVTAKAAKRHATPKATSHKPARHARHARRHGKTTHRHHAPKKSATH
jgi:hypothetical protein